MSLFLRGWRAARVTLLLSVVWAGCALPSYSVGTEGAGGGSASSVSASGGGMSTSVGTGGEGGKGGEGGEGGNSGIACNSDKECLMLKEICNEPSCKGGFCDLGPIDAPDKNLKLGALGNCKALVCENGEPKVVTDKDDVNEDMNDCTEEYCEGANPVQKIVANGTSCGGLDKEKLCFSGKCVQCVSSSDCESGLVCKGARCVPEQCDNQIKDQNSLESDIDCGGPCGPCSEGKGCIINGDCASEVCGPNKTCLAPTCSDGIRNGGETWKDCGGPCPKPCLNGDLCVSPQDCLSHVCYGNKCMSPTCDDEQANGGEEKVDCGGPCPPCLP